MHQATEHSDSQRLRATDFGLIEEMVVWGAKVKQIVKFFDQAPLEAEKYAKKCYKSLGIRPPNGVAGVATSKALKLTIRMQYAALSNQFQNCLERGMDPSSAQLAVFRAHWREFRSQQDSNRIKAAIWIDTARKLMAKTARLVRCGSCSGKQLFDNTEKIEMTPVCMWCGHALPFTKFNTSTQCRPQRFEKAQ